MQSIATLYFRHSTLEHDGVRAILGCQVKLLSFWKKECALCMLLLLKNFTDSHYSGFVFIFTVPGTTLPVWIELLLLAVDPCE